MINIELTNYRLAFDLSLKIPEFQPIYYPLKTWEKRLLNREYIALVAYHNDMAAGFKVGYFQNEKVFYSWMGGVLPDFRKLGIGKTLARTQENLLKERKVELLTMKTRNRNKAMLIMAIKNEFKITKAEHRGEDILNSRIYLQKKL